MEESFNKFLDRSHLPEDVEALKDLVQDCCQKIQGYSEKFLILEETIDYLQSQLTVLKRFQYGQRSERLKKNGCRSQQQPYGNARQFFTIPSVPRRRKKEAPGASWA